MRSYLDILTELQKTIEDDSIPKQDKDIILDMVNDLMLRLWPYSD